MCSETEICRSSQESLTYMGVESYDLSLLNQSMLQANDELTILATVVALLSLVANTSGHLVA